MNKTKKQNAHKKPSEINLNKLSGLGTVVKQIEGVSDFKEKKPETDSSSTEASRGSFIGSFTFNEKSMNYIIIKSNNILFLNFRMNLVYKKSTLPDELTTETGILEHMNKQNSRTIGLKTFLVKQTDDEFIISVNSEYVLSAANENFDFAKNVINILSVSPGILQMQKSEG